MFSKYTITIALVGSASAITREPLLTWKSTRAKTHPMDYPVPSFGQDTEINSNFNSLNIAEKLQKKNWVVTAEDLKKAPSNDYTVPNFGQDNEIAYSLNHTAAAEKTLNHKWVLPTKQQIPTPHPVNYPVANFGQDRDIQANFGSLTTAEKMHKRKWVVNATELKDKNVPAWKEYSVPDFGIDHDIKNTQANYQATEKSLNNKKWNPEGFLNVQLESDPLRTWLPRKAATHPMDYPVANHGEDHDIVSTQRNMENAEKTLEHTWVPKKDKDDKWIVPKVEAVF